MRRFSRPIVICLTGLGPSYRVPPQGSVARSIGLNGRLLLVVHSVECSRSVRVEARLSIDRVQGLRGRVASGTHQEGRLGGLARETAVIPLSDPGKIGVEVGQGWTMEDDDGRLVVEGPSRSLV